MAFRTQQSKGKEKSGHPFADFCATLTMLEGERLIRSSRLRPSRTDLRIFPGSENVQIQALVARRYFIAGGDQPSLP